MNYKDNNREKREIHEKGSNSTTLNPPKSRGLEVLMMANKYPNGGVVL